MTWAPMFFLWVFVTAILAGAGWGIGNRLANR